MTANKVLEGSSLAISSGKLKTDTEKTTSMRNNHIVKPNKVSQKASTAIKSKEAKKFCKNASITSFKGELTSPKALKAIITF